MEVRSSKASGISISTLKGHLNTIKFTYEDLGLKTIFIHEDSLYVCVNEHLYKLESRNHWKIVLPIFISLGITNAITPFVDRGPLAASQWQFLFVCAFMITGFLLLFVTYNRFSKPYSIEDFIREVKKKSF